MTTQIPKFHSQEVESAAYLDHEPWDYLDMVSTMKPMELYKRAEIYHTILILQGVADENFISARTKFMTAYGPTKDHMSALNQKIEVKNLVNSMEDAKTKLPIAEELYINLGLAMIRVKDTVETEVQRLNKLLSCMFDFPYEQNKTYKIAISDIKTSLGDTLNPAILEYENALNDFSEKLGKLQILPPKNNDNKDPLMETIYEAGESIRNDLIANSPSIYYRGGDPIKFEKLEGVLKAPGFLLGAFDIYMDANERIAHGETPPEAYTKSTAATGDGMAFGDFVTEKAVTQIGAWMGAGAFSEIPGAGTAAGYAVGAAAAYTAYKAVSWLLDKVW